MNQGREHLDWIVRGEVCIGWGCRARVVGVVGVVGVAGVVGVGRYAMPLVGYIDKSIPSCDNPVSSFCIFTYFLDHLDEAV